MSIDLVLEPPYIRNAHCALYTSPHCPEPTPRSNHHTNLDFLMGVNLSLLPIYPPGSKLKRGQRTTRRELEEAERQRQLFWENLPSRVISLIVGTGPSVFDKSPCEHKSDAAAAQSRIPPIRRRYFKELKPEVPPGHVRVRFFTSLELMWQKNALPTLEAILPLEVNGEFDLSRIRKLWGLETCVPIDPTRWKVVEPARPNILSPIAVYSLLQAYDCINLTEPNVTQSTMKKRNIRYRLRPYAELLNPTMESLVFYAQKFVNETRLADYYDRAQQDMRYLSLCLEQWAAELTTWQKALLLMITFALVVLFFVLGQLGARTVGPPTKLRWARASVELAVEQ